MGRSGTKPTSLIPYHQYVRTSWDALGQAPYGRRGHHWSRQLSCRTRASRGRLVAKSLQIRGWILADAGRHRVGCHPERDASPPRPSCVIRHGETLKELSTSCSGQPRGALHSCWWDAQAGGAAHAAQPRQPLRLQSRKAEKLGQACNRYERDRAELDRSNLPCPDQLIQLRATNAGEPARLRQSSRGAWR
jgi:hypothetical protein